MSYILDGKVIGKEKYLVFHNMFNAKSTVQLRYKPNFCNNNIVVIVMQRIKDKQVLS